MNKQILSVIKVSALALALSFGISYVYAWTAPTVVAPGGNVAAPINTSATAQTKAGDLTLSGAAAKVTAPNYCIGASCISTWIQAGNIYTAPAAGGLSLSSGAFSLNASNLTAGCTTATGVGKLYWNGSALACETDQTGGGSIPPAGESFLDTSATGQTKKGGLTVGGLSLPVGGTITGSGANSIYGSLSINGSKNGWAGINFPSGAGTVMMNPGYSGFYNSADTTWRWYVTDGGASIQPGVATASDFCTAGGKCLSAGSTPPAGSTFLDTSATAQTKSGALTAAALTSNGNIATSGMGADYLIGGIHALRTDGASAYLFPWGTGYANNTVYVGGGANTNLYVTGQTTAAGGVRFADGTLQTTAASGGGGGVASVGAGAGIQNTGTAANPIIANTGTTKIIASNGLNQISYTGATPGTGTVTLGLLAQTCTSPNVATGFNASGVITCAAPSGGGGGVTSLTAGAGITLSGSTGAVTVSSTGGADNLGNHTATQNLNMAGHAIAGLPGGGALSWGGNNIYSDGASGNMAVRTSGALYVQNQSGTATAGLNVGNFNADGNINTPGGVIANGWVATNQVCISGVCRTSWPAPTCTLTSQILNDVNCYVYTNCPAGWVLTGRTTNGEAGSMCNERSICSKITCL